MTFSSRIYTFYYFVFCRCTRIVVLSFFFFLNDPAPPEIYTLSLHDALPILFERSPDRFWHVGLLLRSGQSGDFDALLARGRIAGGRPRRARSVRRRQGHCAGSHRTERARRRSEEHTSELQSRLHIVCRLLLE